MTGDYPKIISSPEHLRQIEKDKYSTALTDCHYGNSVVAGGRVKNGAKMKKTGSRKSEMKMAAVSEKECFMQL